MDGLSVPDCPAFSEKFNDTCTIWSVSVMHTRCPQTVRSNASFDICRLVPCCQVSSTASIFYILETTPQLKIHMVDSQS
ncbi:hypothetical protein BRADI_1g43066v3 [Brachypodium distachyon]|uniref:Uncharacterized protein n=1 Tax=Brachypodium distachyon TaxID=15368 RepID=A0A2K2DP11_BRADI|nr:hypothetical protein BRADI_1g43066v3 [Brachypodium distachyon]